MLEVDGAEELVAPDNKAETVEGIAGAVEEADGAEELTTLEATGVVEEVDSADELTTSDEETSKLELVLAMDGSTEELADHEVVIEELVNVKKAVEEGVEEAINEAVEGAARNRFAMLDDNVAVETLGILEEVAWDDDEPERVDEVTDGEDTTVEEMLIEVEDAAVDDDANGVDEDAEND